MGGGSAALTGLNVQGATSAAQNEALNNDAGSPGHTAAAVKNGGVAGAAWNLAVVAAGLADQGGAWLVNQFALVANGNRQQQPPSDPNKQLESNEGNDTPSGTAGAVVTPSISVPLPGGAMATIPPVVVPGAPILSSGGGGNDSESTSTGQGAATNTAAEGNPTIQFGANDNQSSHTFRHVISGGYDATAVQNAVTGDLNNIGASLPQGQYTGTVVVNGTTFNYSAYKLPNGTINVGRITPPR